MPDEIKKLFNDLPEKFFSDENLEKALQKARRNDHFRKLNYGRFKVLICGDHNGEEINLGFLEEFKQELRLKGINCWIGNDYIQKAKGINEKDIRESYLNDSDIIVFINGSSAGTIEESNAIRKDKKLNSKTIAFFKYASYTELAGIPDRQNYITEFKYPAPYKELEELRAKITFGVKHMILYFLNKEIDMSARGKINNF